MLDAPFRPEAADAGPGAGRRLLARARAGITMLLPEGIDGFCCGTPGPPRE